MMDSNINNKDLTREEKVEKPVGNDDESSVDQPDVGVSKQVDALKEGRQKGLSDDWQVVYNGANDLIFWICPNTGKSFDRLSKALRAQSDWKKQQEQSELSSPPRSKPKLKRGNTTPSTVSSQSSTTSPVSEVPKKKQTTAKPPAKFPNLSSPSVVRRTSRRNPNLFDRSQLNLSSALRNISDHLVDPHANKSNKAKQEENEEDEESTATTASPIVEESDAAKEQKPESSTSPAVEPTTSTTDSSTEDEESPEAAPKKKKRKYFRNPNSKGPRRRRIDQLCLRTGRVLATHDTIAGAAKSVGLQSSVGISLVCNGRRNMTTSGGYGWQFSKEDYDFDYDDAYGPKQVDQLCLKTGRVIATFDTITEAAKAVGLTSRSGISHCCNGKNNTESAGGYGWRFSKDGDDDNDDEAVASDNEKEPPTKRKKTFRHVAKFSTRDTSKKPADAKSRPSIVPKKKRSRKRGGEDKSVEGDSSDSDDNPQDSGAKAKTHARMIQSPKKKSRSKNKDAASPPRRTADMRVIHSELLFMENGEPQRMTRRREGQMKEFQEYTWDMYVEKIIKRVEVAGGDGYWV